MSVPWYLMAKGKGGGGYKTASGPIVSVNDALAAPLRSLLVNIDPVQDLHGYDNPWPAGGGKNLFGFEEYLKANNVTYTKNGNTYTVTIVDSSLFQNPWVFSDADVAVTISASAYTAGTVTNPRIDLLNSDGNVVSNISPAYLTNQGTACKARINWSTTGTFTISEPMIELGNAKTSFAPYSNICPISGWSEVNVWVKPTYDPTANPTATIQLGQTVYGGTLDVTNGVLTVDRAYKAFDGTENTWFRSSKYNGSFYIATGFALVLNPSLNFAICSHAVRATTFPTGYTFGKFEFDGQSNNPYFNVWIAAANTSLDDFKTYLAGQAQNGTPVSFCCKLATPIEYTLTPTQISTLQGQNNVWADSGNVTVEYLSSGGTDPDLMKLAVAFMGRK